MKKLEQSYNEVTRSVLLASLLMSIDSGFKKPIAFNNFTKPNKTRVDRAIVLYLYATGDNNEC